MIFNRMRQQGKVIVIVIAVAFVVTLLYAGGTSFLSSRSGTASAAAVATVNGKDISYAEFYQAYYSIVRQQEMYGQPITGSMVNQVQYFALDQLVSQELLVQAAEEAKIKADEGLVNERYQELQDHYPSKASFEQDLRNAGLTTKELKELLRTSLKIEQLQKDLKADVEVTEADVVNAYEEVNARHILISIEGDDDEAREAALAKVDQVMKELESGSDFADAAETYSADTGSKATGGELGWFGRGRMVEPFEKAAFAAQIGEIVGPVESQFGYHIIQVTDRKEASGAEFEEAKQEIHDRLLEEKGRERLTEWFSGIRGAADIEIRDPALHAYKLALEGEWEEAAEAYKAAIVADDSDPYLHSSLAQVYEILDMPDLAFQQYELAAEKAGTDSQLWLTVGMMYEEREDTEKAVAAYQKASDSDPMNFLLHLQLMDVYERLGEDELAKVEEDKVAQIKALYEERQRAVEELQKQETEPETEESIEEAEEILDESPEQADTSPTDDDHDSEAQTDYDQGEPGE